MQLNPNAPEFMPLRRVNAPEYALNNGNNNGNNFARISKNIKNSLNKYTNNTSINAIAVGSNNNAMANNWSDPVTNNNYKKLLNKTMNKANNKAMANNLFGSNGNMGAIRRGQRGLAKSLAKNKGKRKNRKATRKNRK